MFSFLFKRVPIGRTLIRGSTTQLGFLQNPSSLKYISSKASRNQNPFVVSYLISSCGLSPAAALSASKKVGFESSDGPDSVLTLFRNHGFTDAQISSLIRKCPLLLVSRPTKTLLPKLEFLHSLGVSSPIITKILGKDSKFLFHSLENKTIPAFNFWKSLVGTLENVVIGLKREARFFNCDIPTVARNIAILRENGVPESIIVSLLTYYPSTLTPKNDMFKQMVEEIKQMDFDLSKYTFMSVLSVFTSMTKSTLKHKLEAYRRWGFSEDEILLAFRRHPQLVGLSLEKRILPRCSVLRVLILKGLVKEDLKMGHLFTKSEKYFLEKFVTNYEKEVPQLLDLYKGNIILLGLG
ncbi:uncharacterized protein LOC122645338 [Telopea speciosissima]|uniref:uncharacterized protein LOC122645338 n=1 Tax=Telopea speciosissima TaxID=54955 RepID=UPI001CC5CFC1|nr:uncharacterized protein LOC122645338 [Telopea speciosissima]